MAKSGVKDRDMGWKRIERETKALRRKSVKVGIQSDAGVNGETGTPVVEYAFYNEYGTSQIPARPFMRTSLDENRADINRTVSKLWGGVMDGKLDADRAANVLGLRHVGQIQQTIDSGDFKKNAPSTIESKTKAGKAGDQPLFNTGQMLNSIRHVVEDN